MDWELYFFVKKKLYSVLKNMLVFSNIFKKCFLQVAIAFILTGRLLI